MPNLTRKYELQVVGDKEEINRVYTWLRQGIEAQNKAMNEYLSHLFMAKSCEMSLDDRKELNNLFQRVTNSKKGSGYTKDIEFPVGLPIAASASRKVKQDFDNACKKGLMYGRISLPTYRSNNPLIVHVRFVALRGTKKVDNGIYHNYNSPVDLFSALENDTKPEVFIKFCNNITFKFRFGNPYKAKEQREVFKRIFTEEYKVGGSTIEIKGTKIIINLTLEVPKVEAVVNEDVVLGVDLGQAVPAMCALNNDYYKRLAIGSADEFLRIRTQIQNERRRLQHALKDSKGGHGRQKKLRALDRLKEREKNFVQTYSHMVSRRVVDFAIKNGAKYINIEDLSGFGRDKYGHVKDDEHSKMILRNWSYYDLQEKIKYKAAIHGIEVRKIDPKYTSQTCSVCGEKGLRQTQKEFICTNPECACHKIYNNQKYINADFNAARNIAMSQNFIEEGEGSKKKSEQKKENSNGN